jgi:hypothetical protein
MTAREQLHDRICEIVHPRSKPNAPAPEVKTPVDTPKTARQNLSDFRQKLEHRFSTKVKEYTKKDFVLDTILLDVPEPGKDQMQGLLVDQRSKRSRRSAAQRFGVLEPRPDFVDLVSVSPIAASLTDVFMRWARKVRIFMTTKDLATLQRAHQLEAGDVASIWEEVLYETFDINLSQLNQLTMRLQD